MVANNDAVTLLKETSWFYDASESFLASVASVMTFMDVKDGYIFAHEGEPIPHLIILQSGKLLRTKVSLSGDHSNKSIKEILQKDAEGGDEYLEHSIVVDSLEGRGRITGLLHVVEAGGVKGQAYATIRSSGPAQVWIIERSDFLKAISSSPQHSLEFIRHLARTVRVGSKSIRGLLSQSEGEPAGGAGGASPKKICKILCYDAATWVTDGFKPAIEEFNKLHPDLEFKMEFTADRLSERSATYAAGFNAICLFVNDSPNAETLKTLSLLGVNMIALRCAGFDRVDQKAALAYGFTVVRVPAYSPYAVAEHAIALLMSVNRQIHAAAMRVKMANFALDSSLMGMDIHGKTVGVMGTGKIGQILCNILHGFGANLLCYDVRESEELKEQLGVKYVTNPDEIYAQSDVLFLMMPLLSVTHHTINEEVLPKLKKGVILINTARGGLIDTKALLKGLQEGIIAGCGLDVFENEQQYFFQDWSARSIEDPDLLELLGNNRVVLTAHQAFFTQEAVGKIIETTLENLKLYMEGQRGHDHPNSIFPAK